MRGILLRFRRGPTRIRPLILMYHRVASPAVDPWGLAVDPDRFDAHLDVLRARRTVMSLKEMVERLDRGTLPENAVAVTFDDGYADNLVVARPRLAAAGIPATLFLATGSVGQPREFWWDEVARAILDASDGLDCEIPVDGHVCRLAIPAGDREPAWRAWQEPQTARQRAYLDLWGRLRAASAAERDAAMARFRDVCRIPPPDAADLPMSASDIGELVSDGSFDIGGHTISHPVLTLLGKEDRRREIAGGRQRCEELARRSIDGFAYPHGAVDDECRAAVRDAGFRWGCSTAEGFVSASCDRYALPRLFVQNWDRAGFERAIS